MSTREGLHANLEATVDHLMVLELHKVPDLLQTSDYARALYLAVKPDAAESAVRDHLKFRHERQTVLTQRTDLKEPDVVYIGTHTGACHLEPPSELAEYRRIFTGAYALGVPISDYCP